MYIVMLISFTEMIYALQTEDTLLLDADHLLATDCTVTTN